MKKLITLGLAVSSIFLLTACSGKKADEAVKVNESELKPYGKYEKPVEFTIGREQRNLQYMPKGDDIKNNAAVRYLKDQTNITPKVTWETADFAQKLALSISTGEIPDVLVVGYDQYQELLKNDLVEDLTTVYEKAASDEVKARIDSYDNVMENVKDDEGKIRAIPMPYYYFEETVTWIREDWLKKVNGKLPESVQDLHDLAKKFKDAKLGGDKTLGFELNPNIMGVFGGTFDASPVVNQLGAYPTQWVEKDGKAVYGSIQPETKEALKLLASWFKEGLIDPQFPVRSDEERDGVVTNSVGIHFGPWWDQTTLGQAYKQNPEANWIAIPGPKDDSGKFQTFKGTPVIRYVVVKKGYEHPEAVMRALNNVTDFNFSVTDEAKEFRKKEKVDSYFPWYYAPIDYKLDYAEANRNDYESMQKAVKAGNDKDLPAHLSGSFKNIQNYLAGSKKFEDWSEYSSYFEGLKAGTDKESVYNTMAFYGKTPTMKQKWANLQKLENESFLKIVMGEADIDSFDKFVTDWNKQGGEQITKEVNEQLSKKK